MDERIMILEMVSSGKISPDDAILLLNALGDEDDTNIDQEEGFEDDEPGFTPVPPSPPAPPIPPTPPVPPTARHTTGPIHIHHSRRMRTPDAGFAAAVTRAGFEFTPRQLLTLQEHDVSVDEIRAMKDVSKPDWDVDELVELLVSGVQPTFINRLRELGIDTGPRFYLRLNEVGAELDYIETLLSLDLSGFRLEDLADFTQHGVDLEAVRQVLQLGPLSARDALELGIHGIREDYVVGMRSLGLEELTARDLLEMKIHGVKVDEAEEIKELDLPDFSAKKLVELRIHDVDPEFVRGFIDLGFPDLTLSKLVELRIHGVDLDYTRGLMALELPDLTLSRLVELKIHGVSLGAARRAAEKHPEEISATYLVEGAIHGWLDT